ncbi:FAD-dependent oxidoreductase [Selenihalanaerobacter shriftii]|uniref:Electron transfer flavoprotein-quinone oxidoreductase n=1 Tax=Selenihalanaerobacter shriftii TaxID=142842 RepID=A0A1T4QVM3_9FIRM|nr:FAD-dependent oxidoreductase [Selenihalanaerobacter shriftii]SKA07755.1 electron transfer flavoprotein-quinone oxidoreductase [Selenihalanaerobacter shriftii]
MVEEKFDAIVVGAGPSGLAAGYTMAKAGMNVIIFERGDYPGSKNVMGGVLYRDATEELIPDFWEEAPVERYIVEQNIWVLDDDSVVTMGYQDDKFAEEPYNNFTVLRAKIDRWLANKVEEAGALLITETVVEDLLYDEDKVVGVQTGRKDGEVKADVVILAEGVNSLIGEQADLHPKIPPEHLAVAVKEIIALPKETIEARFNLNGDEGKTIELVGKATEGMMGTAFIYTNKKSLSIGVGAILSDMVDAEMNPNDLLEELKSHPAVQRLIKGGETKEYLAHLIPEGGYHGLPELYRDGLLVVGDAAMLVNGFHREGSNLAMLSGKFAGETAVDAKEAGDFSANKLSLYKDKLDDSFIMKDLYKYKDASTFLATNPHFLSLYPKLVNESLHEIMVVDGKPKQEKQRKIIKKVKDKRSYFGLAKDMFNLWRVMR